MRNKRILAAFALLATAAAANAEVTGTAAIVSDYDFRGISQSGEDPAVQLSIDYGHESGWYAGVWGSSVDHFGDPIDGVGEASTEVDVYTGYKFGTDAVSFDVGLVYYAYPGVSNINYAELYGKVTAGIFTGSVYYTNDYSGNDDYAELVWLDPAIDGGAAFYVAGDVNIPAGPVTVGLHAGYSDGDGIEGLLGVEDSYFDYSVGVSYSASNVTLSLKWVAADGDDAGSDDRVVLGISTALPWE
jgi:uncharacterized protein (TIGR02001 family)